MTIDDILNLTRAGFTKAEILALVNPAPESPQNPPKQAQPEPEPETPPPAPEPVPAEPAAPAPAPAAHAPTPADPAGPTTQDLMAAIQGLTAAMQSANRKMAQMPDQHQMTGEDVLAQIIRPPRS